MSPEREESPPDLGINVQEQVKTSEAFGKLERNLKGIGGTLHLTNREDGGKVVQLAWELSQQTQRPVVIVVRAT